MSNQVKNAIDMGLMGLSVTEGDVAAILRRVRTEADGSRRSSRPAQRINWRLTLALAVVMLMLVAAVGLRLTSQGPADMTPLAQPDAQSTEVPEGFVPVKDGAAEPVISVTAAQAIAIAENYVQEYHDPAVNLRDAAAYEITCDYTQQETLQGVTCTNFYAVRFRALTAEGTEYLLRVSAADGSVLSCELQRGVGEEHTAQEIYIGYARLYGADRREWTQEQLRTYCLSLKRAKDGSRRWEDYLYLLSSYPDVAQEAMTREEVIAAVTDDLDMLLYEYDEQFGEIPRWSDAELVGSMRARYISAYPNPVWKVAVDQRVVSQEGYETTRTVLFEIDSVTGEVKHVEAVDALYAFQYESFTHSTIDALKATTTNSINPSPTQEEYAAIAADYVRARWGEERDINDEALFTCTTGNGDIPTMQCELRLIYRSVGAGETTEYVLFINWYGEVVAANRSITPEGETPFTPVAPDLDWRMENLLDWQGRAAASSRADEPEMQAFIGTVWLDDHRDGMPQGARDAALEALGARATTDMFSVTIDAEPNPVVKLALETDQGNFLVEVDSVTNEVISILQVNGLCDTWYLPFVLTEDLKAAGVPIPEDAAHVYLSGATEAHGACDGMRVDHLYEHFKDLYGPDMSLWTQEQLRSFQRMAVLSDDYDYDLGVICLRNTTYPDIPENAISREAAARAAADVIGLEEAQWQFAGAVLIGTADGTPANGTPVWKVCLRTAAGDFWYAEVNCMTGKVYRLHQDAAGTGSPGASYDYGTPQNLWFRDIVLEETIEDCDAVWECMGNG